MKRMKRIDEKIEKYLTEVKGYGVSITLYYDEDKNLSPEEISKRAEKLKETLKKHKKIKGLKLVDAEIEM